MSRGPPVRPQPVPKPVEIDLHFLVERLRGRQDVATACFWTNRYQFLKIIERKSKYKLALPLRSFEHVDNFSSMFIQHVMFPFFVFFLRFSKNQNILIAQVWNLQAFVSAKRVHQVSLLQ